MIEKKLILEKLKEIDNKYIFDYELFEVLELSEESKDEFNAILLELEKEGLVMKSKKGKYALSERLGLILGTVDLAQRGFGFLKPENKEIEDIFIAKRNLNGAVEKDMVLISTYVNERNNEPEGVVEKIVSRGIEELVGVFQENKAFGFVVPQNQFGSDVFIPKAGINGARDGDKVKVKLTDYGSDSDSPEGEIVEIIGENGTIEAEVKGILSNYNLQEYFPEDVKKEIKVLKEELPEEEVKRRKDFRDELIVTIDGRDSKDFDDAIHVKKFDDGTYELGVHIADVAHYVKEGAPLDKEALRRGTSVYLIDIVIPMLPKVLSNGLCSLNPHVDRFALSIVMKIDKMGKVLDQHIYESVINSSERLVYDDVSDILEGVREIKEYDYLDELFTNMKDLSIILRESRVRRGMIDFNFPETYINVEDNITTEIRLRDRRIANRIIEEFMLKANETIAEYFYWLELPFVYRIHEEPKEEKIAEFSRVLSNFGYTIKKSGDELHPKELQKLLGKIKGKKEEVILNKLMLRSLRQAKYNPVNEGHFGLAATYYCHFTSPIRRYPDLQIHRIIKEYINGKLSDDRINHYDAILSDVSEASSFLEREAEKAERDMDDLRKAQYLSERIGEEYNGFISSITPFGMFVQLENTIEGLIRIEDLKDSIYEFDKESITLKGMSGNIFRIGENVRIRVESASIMTRKIDFEFIERIEEKEEKDVNSK